MACVFLRRSQVLSSALSQQFIKIIKQLESAYYELPRSHICAAVHVKLFLFNLQRILREKREGDTLINLSGKQEFIFRSRGCACAWATEGEHETNLRDTSLPVEGLK